MQKSCYLVEKYRKCVQNCFNEHVRSIVEIKTIFAVLNVFKISFHTHTHKNTGNKKNIKNYKADFFSLFE